VTGVEIANLVPHFHVRLEDFVLLEVVPVLVDHRRASVLHGPNHEVQVAPALRALVERIEPKEMADHLLEAGMGIVEAETDAVTRKDVHLFEELLVEDPRLLENATLLCDVVLGLRHGAQRTAPVRLKPAPRSRSVVTTVRYVRNDYRTSVAAMDHGREPKSLGEPVYRRDVHPGRYRVGDHRGLGPGERPRGTGELHARTRIVPDRGRRRRGQLVHHGPPFVPSHRRRRNRDERLVL